MELENLVRFSSYPRPFAVYQTFCSNPNCRCNAAFLTFKEVTESGQGSKPAMSFSIRVDLRTWREVQPPHRPPQVTAWVQEFLERCPVARRAEYKAAYEEQRRVVQRKAQYTIAADEVRSGTLFSYCCLLTDESAISDGGNAYTFQLQYRGHEYLVEDQYCPNPDCDCQSVHVVFYETVTHHDGAVHIYQRFSGQVTLAGELVVEKTTKCDLALAKAALGAWWQEHRHELGMLKDRYGEVKEIGRRSLHGRPAGSFVSRPMPGPSAEELLADDGADLPSATSKVGRNAACPCGSGKKYKKCCLPNASMAR
jgi:hypothetical protein